MQRKFLLFSGFFLLVFCNLSYSGEVEFVYPLNNVTIFQGESLETRVVLENTGNETIEWIQIRTSTPTGIEIKQLTEIEVLEPNGRGSFKFEIIVDGDVTLGDKEIKLTAESDGSSLGEGYTFNITVLKNPSITTTTTIEEITTTTIEETTTTTTTTLETVNTTTTTIEPKKSNFSKISMIIVAIIIIASLVIPIVFLKSMKKEEHPPFSVQTY